ASAAGTAGVAGAVGTAAAPGGTAQGQGGMSISGAAAGSITSAGGPNVSIVGGNESVAISNRTSAMIDIAQVQGEVHAQSVQKVGELANKNPGEAVSIVRRWLLDAAALWPQPPHHGKDPTAAASVRTSAA